MSEPTRSELACPVCSQHTLALDRPPEIDVMGVQQYLDLLGKCLIEPFFLLGMGDLENEGPVGIVCLNCKTRWRDRDAFDRNEPDASAGPADVDFSDGGDGGE